MNEEVIKTVENLIVKEAALIEHQIDTDAEHSTEVENLTRLLDSRLKMVEGDRADHFNGIKADVAERELTEKLAAGQEDRFLRNRELDLKTAESKVTVRNARQDIIAKKHETAAKYFDITGRVLVGVLGVVVPTAFAAMYVDRGFKMEASGEYQTSQMLRWIANKIHVPY